MNAFDREGHAWESACKVAKVTHCVPLLGKVESTKKSHSSAAYGLCQERGTLINSSLNLLHRIVIAIIKKDCFLLAEIFIVETLFLNALMVI